MAKSKLDPVLLDFCSPSQKKILSAVISEGSLRAAASKLDKPVGTVSGTVTKVRRQAAARGWSPECDNTKIVPETHYLKGTSTLYDADGNIAMQWVKSQVDTSQIAAVAKEAATAFFEHYEPLPPVRGPAIFLEDLLTTYVISDLHLGMYSWARETGSDYDADIASSLLIGAMKRLVSRTPSSGQCLIAQLGDLLHLDDETNQTKRSKNALDVDTRYQRVAEVGLRLYRRTIDMALQNHDRVHVVNVQGNHDDISSYWLGVAIKTAYENNPRVTVDTGRGPYFYYRFGSNLIGMTHGDACKMASLGEIMVADKPRDAGNCENRYWLTGHIHHDRVLETRICKVESFRTLAAKDAWHHRSGYRSGRDMKAIVYHRKYGEDERFRVGIREIEDGMSKVST